MRAKPDINPPKRISAFPGIANPIINTPVVAYSHGIGWSAPNATYNVGADFTLTPKIVSTTRFGYFFENYHDFGWQTSTPNLDWRASGCDCRVDGTVRPLPIAQGIPCRQFAAEQRHYHRAL